MLKIRDIDLLILNNLKIKKENKTDKENNKDENSFLNGTKILGNAAVESYDNNIKFFFSIKDVQAKATTKDDTNRIKTKRISILYFETNLQISENSKMFKSLLLFLIKKK